MLNRFFRFALIFAMLFIGPVISAQAQSTLSVNITSPNGGEILTVGQTYRITWQSSPEIDMVTIGYKSCPSCLDWIAYNIPNTGYYDWNVFVGNTINTQFTLEIIAYDTGVGSVVDYSDAAFTVLPAAPTPSPMPLPTFTPTPLPLSLKVTAPNGGESLTVGQVYRITWQSSPEVDTVSLGYKSCSSCLDWIVTNIPNIGYYDWSVYVGNTTNTQFMLEIIGYDTGIGQVIDYSDATFTVLQPHLDAPVLVTPINGKTISTVRPAFDWLDVSGATSYTLQVSASSDFSNPLVNLSTATSFYDASKLPRGVVLYWRVRAFGQINPSDWSSSTFKIK